MAYRSDMGVRHAQSGKSSESYRRGRSNVRVLRQCKTQPPVSPGLLPTSSVAGEERPRGFREGRIFGLWELLIWSLQSPHRGEAHLIAMQHMRPIMASPHLAET